LSLNLLLDHQIPSISTDELRLVFRLVI
jgi:hypothetical protein